MDYFIEIELIKTVNLMKRKIEESIIGAIDRTLTVSQAHVIGFIAHNSKKRDIYQKDIESAFELHRSSVSLMLTNMEKSGFIQRVSVEDDARLKKIILTKRAQELQEKIQNGINKENEIMLKDISLADQKHMIEVLQRIRKNIK